MCQMNEYVEKSYDRRNTIHDRRMCILYGIFYSRKMFNIRKCIFQMMYPSHVYDDIS